MARRGLREGGEVVLLMVAVDEISVAQSGHRRPANLGASQVSPGTGKRTVGRATVGMSPSIRDLSDS